MRSRASFKAHPLHPALIPFPFAFLIGALLFDLAGVVTSNPALTATAGHLILAGLAAGLLAAVPGVIDYLQTVPPNSSAQARARKHGLGNTAALVLFGVAFLLRDDEWAPTSGSLLVEIAGALTLAYAGWLGGTLVTRNLIGVDHRYARSGKWQEQRVDGERGKPIDVGSADDLEDDQMKLLHVNGRRIVLGRSRGQYVAFDDACSHRGGSLADGALVDGTVQCLWHGSQFDIRSGAVRCGPAEASIRAYEIRVQEGRLLLASRPE